jgi:hypothetical protein
LADLGQLNTTVYPRNESFNPFLNWSMLEYYIDLYNRTYPGFIPSTHVNIQQYNTDTFVIPPALLVQDYTCNQMQLKPPLSIIIVLVSGLYPMLHGGYKGLQALLQLFFKPHGSGSLSIYSFLLQTLTATQIIIARGAFQARKMVAR